MYLKTILATCLAAGSLSAAPYLWLEKPSSHNFNWTDSWPTMDGRKSTSLKPNRPVPEKPFFELDFECKTLGTYAVWGRTYDPAASSIGQWRIDTEAWRTWAPEKKVDRMVHGKIQVLDWCRWGTVKLEKGKHKLRFEALEKRKHGDYHYFILDAIMLIQDPHFRPSGAVAPFVQAEKLSEEIKKQSKNLESVQMRSDILSRQEDALRFSKEDTAGLLRLRSLLNRMSQTNKTVDDGTVKLLNGTFASAKIEGNRFSYKITWNRPRMGHTLLVFTEKQAFYGAVKTNSDLTTSVLEGCCELPALPAGVLTVYAIPLEEPAALSASVHLPIPSECIKNDAHPSSWGIYRDSKSILHPWHTTPSNIMVWDGEPYVPFGGMINTRLSWTSKPDTADDNASMKYGEKLLSDKLDFLIKNGIRDVYYNGFFLKSNPNWMRRVVELSEEKGMRYGLHIGTMPEIQDKGFVRHQQRILPVPSGTRSMTVDPMKSFAEMPPRQKAKFKAPEIEFPCRSLWMLTDEKGDFIECGIVRSDNKNLFQISFSSSAGTGCSLTYIPEMQLPIRDPAGYLSGIETHCRRIRSIYGSLKLGPGLRFFVDPLNNEMHTRPLSVPISAEFRKRNELFLFGLYGDIATLNKTWGTEKTRLPDFKTAARLVPLWSNALQTIWMDPETSKRYIAKAENAQSLRDLKEFRGKVCRDIINQATDVLKEIADVPVFLKHNTWFSDWFVNDRTVKGYDGTGMESYCYGDSLAYHNSAVVYGEVMQSARNQWCVVSESSAAAFEGQKDYCGYFDRLQMLHDIDQLMMLGAKGFYHFGFQYDPGAGKFYTTDITRDPRQLEWLTTLGGIYRKAGDRFQNYRPSYHGWFPAYLREREITNVLGRPFDMDGDYTGTAARIRMAPDGRWIIPALNPSAPWKTLFSVKPLQNERQRAMLKDLRLANRVELDQKNLNSFTANGIGVIPPTPGNPDLLQEYRRTTLGYETFQTEELNGFEVKDGKVMVWVCAERSNATLRLPSKASVWTLKGKELPKSGDTVTMVRPEHKKITENHPPHIGGGYYFADAGETECVEIRGATKEDILKLNDPAWHRWLPAGVQTANVLCFREAEDFQQTTFLQPSLVGYARYSGGRAIGINTNDAPPAGKHYEAGYKITLPKKSSSPVFHLRRMVQPALDISIWVDGKKVGTIPADAPTKDTMHLSPWNAGLLKNALKVSWYSLPLPELSAGAHTILLRAEGISSGYTRDTRLMGGEAERFTGSHGANTGMRAIQLDCFAIEDSKN